MKEKEEEMSVRANEPIEETYLVPEIKNYGEAREMHVTNKSRINRKERIGEYDS